MLLFGEENLRKPVKDVSKSPIYHELQVAHVNARLLHGDPERDHRYRKNRWQPLFSYHLCPEMVSLRKH